MLTLQTPEVLELSKQIKEKLKEADQYGNINVLSIYEFLFSVECFRTCRLSQLKMAIRIGYFSIMLVDLQYLGFFFFLG